MAWEAEIGRHVLTDSLGRFRIHDLPSDAGYRVVVGADSFQGWTFGPFGPLLENNDPIIRLHPRQDHSGPLLVVRVLDATGAPLGGAWVTPTATFREPELGPNDALYGGAIHQAQLTGPSGEVVFQVTGDETYDISARAAGHATAVLFGLPADTSGRTTCVLRLTDGAVVQGRLAGAASLRSGVTVALTRLDKADVHERRAGEAVTDSEGRYRFSHLTPDTDYRIFVPMDDNSRAGASSAVTVHTGPDGSLTTGQAMNVERTYQLSGRVMAGDLPVGGREGWLLLARRVAYENREGGFEDKKMARPDSLGRFSISGVPGQLVEVQIAFNMNPAPGATAPIFRDPHDGKLMLDVRRDERDLLIRLVARLPSRVGGCLTR